MATATTEPRIGRVDAEEEEQHDRLVSCDGPHDVVATEVNKRVSRLAVEGNKAAGGDHGVYKIGGDGGSVVRSAGKLEDAVRGGRRSGGGGGGGRTLPPPHAWLAIEDTKKHYDSGPEEQWMRLLRGRAGAGAGSRQRQRRSSFSVARRERAAREAWLDRAWEMKRSWHQRNGGAPDADTPVVVVVGKGHAASSPCDSHQQAGAVGGGGVAMDVEEVRACRDLGLELPSDGTVEIQCYGLSGGSSPTNTASSGGDSPGATSSPGADPIDVKARLKVWAQAVALASTTHLGS